MEKHLQSVVLCQSQSWSFTDGDTNQNQDVMVSYYTHGLLLHQVL